MFDGIVGGVTGIFIVAVAITIAGVVFHIMQAFVTWSVPEVLSVSEYGRLAGVMVVFGALGALTQN